MRLKANVSKKLTASAIILSLGAALSAQAASPPAAPQPSHSKVTITTQNLDSLLFDGNSDVLHQMQTVLEAKDDINIKRGQLLPSLNLSVLFSFSNPAMFMLNSVSCLVPFLFPSRWYDLKTYKSTYNAEVMGLHVTKLNLYATTYTMLTRVQGDEAQLAMMEAQYKRLDEQVDSLKVRISTGYAGAADLERAQIDANNRQEDLSKMRQLIAEERAAIRRAFGYDLDTELEIALDDVSPTSLEGQKPTDDLLAKLVQGAPEKQQWDLAVQSAKASTSSTEWAFLSGCSGSQGGISTSGGTTGLSISTGVGINLGFDYFPRVKLARHAEADAEMHLTDMTKSMGSTLETTLADVSECKLRMAEEQDSLDKAELVLKDSQTRYAAGTANIREVLEAYSLVEKANVDLVSSKAELNGHRITLKRLAMEDQFQSILAKSEAATAPATPSKSGAWNWVKNHL